MLPPFIYFITWT